MRWRWRAQVTAAGDGAVSTVKRMDVRVAPHNPAPRRASKDGAVSRSRPATAGRSLGAAAARQQPPTLTLHLSDAALGHHGGYHQRYTGAVGDSGTRGTGEALRGSAKRGRGQRVDGYTDLGDSGRLLPGRPRMAALRLSGQDQEKQRHRRRLEALSQLGLNTAADLALHRPLPRVVHNIPEPPHLTLSSPGASRPEPLRASSSRARVGGVESVLDPIYMTEPTAEADNPAEFKIRRPLTTRELTKKIKKHQAAVRRERRRFIAGAERPPARKKASYLEMLENRQEFRRVLVKLLKTEEAAGGPGRGQLDRRYHYFITRGLSMRTSPFQKSWVSAILALVPKHLRQVQKGEYSLKHLRRVIKVSS
ncbi:hypothetical protein E2C01_040025 [Portunus trituberculatus]|uniref:Uncharacterized protein n=1 Tax=Portunus trituberculatus TaxID=210409 RepID=A0A5B7FM75_PORTR|nr:hypothetical protein [Portunus trituberculatus]